MTTLTQNLLSRKRPCECCATTRAAAWVKLSHAGLRDDSEAVAHDVHEQDGWVACKVWIENEFDFKFTKPFFDSVLAELDDSTPFAELTTRQREARFRRRAREAGVEFASDLVSTENVNGNVVEVRSRSHMVDAMRYAMTANTGADPLEAYYPPAYPATSIALSQDGKHWDSSAGDMAGVSMRRWLE